MSGLFFTLDLPFPVAGIDHKAHKANIIGTGKELFSLTHLDDIGRFVAAILKKPEETENKVIRIAGDTQSADALVEKFEKKSGKKFKVKYQNAIVLAAALKQARHKDHKKYEFYFTNAIPLFTGDGVCPSTMLTVASASR
jgi:nucleoside-diphosphate-sugar epimerase